MARYCLNSYSIPDLLKLLMQARGERIRLEVGSLPSLLIKDRDFEIDGPVIEEEVAGNLLQSVADSRQKRSFRQFGTVDIIYPFDGANFLIRAVAAFGTFNLELHTIKT